MWPSTSHVSSPMPSAILSAAVSASRGPGPYGAPSAALSSSSTLGMRTSVSMSATMSSQCSSRYASILSLIRVSSMKAPSVAWWRAPPRGRDGAAGASVACATPMPLPFRSGSLCGRIALLTAGNRKSKEPHHDHRRQRLPAGNALPLRRRSPPERGGPGVAEAPRDRARLPRVDGRPAHPPPAQRDRGRRRRDPRDRLGRRRQHRGVRGGRAAPRRSSSRKAPRAAAAASTTAPSPAC